MGKFFKDYLLFTIKSITVILIFFVISFSFGNFQNNENKPNNIELLTIRDLTKQYRDVKQSVIRNIYTKKEADKFIDNKYSVAKNRTFVIKFYGDMEPKQVNSLKKEISAILSIASNDDNVVLILESSGGTVSGYGLAASELERIRNKGIHLTVLVDKIAASGGYMMAAVANKIIAAPFAIIGSIGVLTEMPNFNELLEKNGIQYEQITSGQYKKTISIFGKNTEEGRKKLQKNLDDVHEIFKQLIKSKRKNIDLDKVSTGEIWLATQAKDLGLVDEIMTSEDYLVSLYKNDESVFLVNYERQMSFIEKIIDSFDVTASAITKIIKYTL